MTVAWRPNDLSLQHAKQVGPSCVATTLSMVANATGAQTTPEDLSLIHI